MVRLHGCPQILPHTTAMEKDRSGREVQKADETKILPPVYEEIKATKRELEIFQGYINGKTDREIGDRAYIKTRTVREIRTQMIQRNSDLDLSDLSASEVRHLTASLIIRAVHSSQVQVEQVPDDLQLTDNLEAIGRGLMNGDAKNEMAERLGYSDANIAKLLDKLNKKLGARNYIHSIAMLAAIDANR